MEINSTSLFYPNKIDAMMSPRLIWDSLTNLQVSQCSTMHLALRKKLWHRKHSLANREKDIKMSAHLQLNYYSLSLSFAHCFCWLFCFLFSGEKKQQQQHKNTTFVWGLKISMAAICFFGSHSMAWRANPHGLPCQSISVLQFSFLWFPSSLPLLDGPWHIQEIWFTIS